MRTNIRLDSFLASSSSGMDLSKGVPAGKSSAQSTSLKDEVSFEKSFDDQLKDPRADSKQATHSLDRQGSMDSKSSSAGNKDVDSVRKAKPAKQRDLRESEVEGSEVSQGDAQKVAIVQGSREVSDEENVINEGQANPGSFDAKVDETTDALVLLALPVNEMIAAQDQIQDPNLSASGQGIKPESMKSGQMKEGLLMDGKDAGVEIPSEMTEVIDQTLSVSADEQDAALLEAPSELKEAQPTERAQSIKDFAAELWIHRNVDAESKLSGKSDLNIAFNQESAPQKPLSIRDLDPLVSKLVTTKTGGEMNLQMRPAHLGMVKVEILTEGDAVKVNLFAEKASAQSALSSQVNELKQQLHAVGLKVETVTVSTLQSNSTEQSRDGQNQQQSRHQQENPQQRPQQRDAQREFDLDGWGEEAA